MARRASKATIAANLKAYGPWREQVERRAAAIGPNARYVLEWADDLKGRIEAGDIGPCEQALCRSVMRELESWESGYYVALTPGGGRRCASVA